jgi:acyl-CoA reductase-like NAD-dependent aldehyde dehydrogenase
MVADMRTTFEAGLSLPLSKRRQQLRALQQMLQENEEQICEALLEGNSHSLVYVCV